MIEYIKLRNFQCHGDILIRFDKNITTITGPSDAGKSAIIRALRWVFLNKPSGVSFIKNGEKICTVTVKIDGKKIKRIRGKSRNEYHFNGEIFKAFGNTVPDPIREFLKIIPNNFQNQHDSPFWVSLPAGQLSRAVNEIVDLSSIDKCLVYLNSKNRKIKTRLEITDEETTTAITEQKRLRKAKSMDRDLRRVEKAERRWKESESAVSRAILATHAAQESTKQKRRLDARLEIAGRYTANLDVLRKDAETARQESERLKSLIQEIEETRSKKVESGAIILSLSQKLKQFKACPLCQTPLQS